MAMDLQEKIPNNVNLSSDKRLRRALEQWLPNYLQWWRLDKKWFRKFYS